MIALFSALPGETDPLRRMMTSPRDASAPGGSLTLGRIGGMEALLSVTGVGKVQAALAVAHVMEHYRPEFIIFCGIAGGLSDAWRIGDIVAARECLQHDFNATALGYSRGEVPDSALHVMKSDPRLLDWALGYTPSGWKLGAGRILSGDTVIGPENRSAFAYLTEELLGDGVDMESAGAAVAASRYGVPFLVLRAISDRPGMDSPRSFSRTLKKGGRRLALVIEHLLQQRQQEGALKGGL